MSERTVQRHLICLKESGVVQGIRLPVHDSKNRLVAWRDGFLLKLAGVEVAPEHDYSTCPKWLRAYVLESFSLTCVYCERIGDIEADPDGNPWEVDRIKPGSKGGKYEPCNVTLACRRCNTSKGASDRSAISLEEKVGGPIVGPSGKPHRGVKMTPSVGVKVAPVGAKNDISVGANLSPYKEPSLLQPSVEPKTLDEKPRRQDFQPTPELQERDRDVHPIRYLLTYFDLAYMKKVGKRHPKFGDLEAARAKELIDYHGLQEVLGYADKFMQLEDAWLQKTGYSFRIFSSSSQLVKAQAVGVRAPTFGVTARTAGNRAVFRRALERGLPK